MVSPSIPASQLVNVIPGVLSPGGLGKSLTGLILSNAQRVPVGTAISFPSAQAVGTYFGFTAPEYFAALVYFAGPDNSQIKPASLLFFEYDPLGKQSAYLRGGSVATLGLAGLQALTPGTIQTVIDGVTTTSSSINLSGATSLSNAASIIQTAIGQQACSFTASITTTVMTVTGTPTGTLAVGQIVTGTGVSAGTVISSLGTGTGGAGTYNIFPSQTVSSTTMQGGLVTVAYDSIGGGFQINSGYQGATVSTAAYAPTSSAMLTALNLTQATGAIISQGDNINTPAQIMASVISQTSNWGGFCTITQGTVAQETAFAAWTSGQNGQFFYAPWINDITVVSPNPTTSLPYAVQANSYSGTIVCYAPVNTYLMSAFVLGWAASINFGQTNGRLNLTFRTQAGLAPDVTNGTYAAQLILNGCNFYGAYGTSASIVNSFQNGSISGPFLWADSFVNQINLNNNLQVALLSLLSTLGNIPYNDQGYGYIDEACSGPIAQAINFGSIRPGVTLTPVQAAEINALAGQPVDLIVSSRGWYLSVQPASPQVRAARQSPPIDLFYCDGQSVQQLNLFSEEVA